MSPEEKAWCDQELKIIDQHHQPKLSNPDSKSIGVVVQGLLFQTGQYARAGKLQASPTDSSGQT